MSFLSLARILKPESEEEKGRSVGFYGNLEMGLSQKLRKKGNFRGWMIMNRLS